MKSFWSIEQYKGGWVTIGYFDDLDLAQDALETLRNRYMDVYLNTQERIDAWNERPYFNARPELDEYGLEIYNRGIWIERSLEELEDFLSYFEIVEHNMIESLDELKVDCYYNSIDDDRTENYYRLHSERMRIQYEKKRKYEMSRIGKPKGLP